MLRTGGGCIDRGGSEFPPRCPFPTGRHSSGGASGPTSQSHVLGYVDGGVTPRSGLLPGREKEGGVDTGCVGRAGPPDTRCSVPGADAEGPALHDPVRVQHPEGARSRRQDVGGRGGGGEWGWFHGMRCSWGRERGLRRRVGAAARPCEPRSRSAETSLAECTMRRPRPHTAVHSRHWRPPASAPSCRTLALSGDPTGGASPGAPCRPPAAPRRLRSLWGF